MLRVSRTFYDLYILYFSPEIVVKFTRKAKGHSVTLIQGGMRLITLFLDKTSSKVGLCNPAN